MFNKSAIYAIPPGSTFKDISNQRSVMYKLVGHQPFVVIASNETGLISIRTVFKGEEYHFGHSIDSTGLISFKDSGKIRSLREIIEVFDDGDVLTDCEVLYLYDHFNALSVLVGANQSLKAIRYYAYLNEAKLRDIINARFP